MIDAEGCAAFSNSTHIDPIKSKKSSLLRAETICSSGGTEGGDNNFYRPPYTDCPAFEKSVVVALEPGVVKISNDDLVVNNNAKLLGERVGLVFAGKGSNMISDRETEFVRRRLVQEN